MKRITDEEIGDCLDMDAEKIYPRADYSRVLTVNVDAVADAQLAADKKAEADWLEKWSFRQPTPTTWRDLKDHIAELRGVKHD